MSCSVTSDSPIFIVGCPRSGTALLRNLLRSHPHLAFPTESHFIPAYYRGYGDPRSAREARRLAESILRLYWVRIWKLSLRPGDFADCRSFREVVCRLFETFARQQGKRRWGDKTPHYVAQIPVLLELFPAAKILQIIRDGRDVALSWLKTRMEPRNLYTAARMWRELVRAGREAGARLPRETYLEVRYERLLAEPEQTMREVLRLHRRALRRGCAAAPAGSAAPPSGPPERPPCQEYESRELEHGEVEDPDACSRQGPVRIRGGGLALGAGLRNRRTGSQDLGAGAPVVGPRSPVPLGHPPARARPAARRAGHFRTHESCGLAFRVGVGKG